MKRSLASTLDSSWLPESSARGPCAESRTLPFASCLFLPNFQGFRINLRRQPYRPVFLHFDAVHFMESEDSHRFSASLSTKPESRPMSIVKTRYPGAGNRCWALAHALYANWTPTAPESDAWKELAPCSAPATSSDGHIALRPYGTGHRVTVLRVCCWRLSRFGVERVRETTR
ncbi:hypothetical protein BJY00DRAFT_64250 [Aspergillus carlsbadensis]|nr:hypothetical protein BJY00DRAFT_64250 [Aspergillus carlsbadensis]